MGETLPNIEAVADAMNALGSAWRGDWSFFDGRQLRDELGDLSMWLTSPEPKTYEEMCLVLGVCPESRCWPEYCDESTSATSCKHLEHPPVVGGPTEGETDG